MRRKQRIEQAREEVMALAQAFWMWHTISMALMADLNSLNDQALLNLHTSMVISMGEAYQKMQQISECLRKEAE